jgi:hypothetical protein
LPGARLLAHSHVIALNEQHLRRLMRDYVNYHHEDRVHDSLQKDNAKSAVDRAEASSER